MKVICIGDSCTYGQNVRARDAWPAWLQRLQFDWDVRNEGVCGDTSRLGLERWRYAVGLHKPDVVVIQFGHNDCNLWATDDGAARVGVRAYVGNLADMCHRTRLIEAEPIVIAPHASLIEVNYDIRVQIYADQARSNLRGVVLPAVGVSLLEDGYGVHPNERMHARYAQAVERAIIARRG